MKAYKIILLATACLVAGAAAVRAQTPDIVLKPIDTGRGVIIINLGDNEKSYSPGRFQLKTNLLWGGALQAPNLAFEMATGERTSVEVVGGASLWGNMWDNGIEGEPFDINNLYKRRLDHVFGKAEFRYWLRERFRGHFFGAGALFADYRVGELDIPLLFEKEYEYDGVAYGAAVSYGYLWRWSPRWGMEFSVSGGIVRFDYHRGELMYGSQEWHLDNVGRMAKTYLGPTGAGIRLVFTIE